MHRIRLRGPWNYAATYVAQNGQPDYAACTVARGVVKFPGARWADVAPSDQAPRGLRLERSFGGLSGLEPGETVELVLDSAPGLVQASLNDQPLALVEDGDAPHRWVITPRVQPRNLLRIELTPPAVGKELARREILGEVRMEIGSRSQVGD